MSVWEPTSMLAKIVHFAGFDYSPEQDIIYSRMDATQRYFGYASGYDRSALAMSAAIDCEPIFFRYDNKIWMIELWKGQYGVETGCEIGVYVREPDGGKFDPNHYILSVLDKLIGDRPHDTDPDHNLFFKCADDSQRLNMESALYRKREGDGEYEVLFRRGPEFHWWLTGFKWGVYSAPEDLKMEVKISFPNAGMQRAFVDTLRNMGYTFSTYGFQVSFTFDKPKTQPQPRYDPESIPLIGSLVPEVQKLTLDAVNQANREIVAIYQGIYKEFNLNNNDPNNIPDHVMAKLAPYLAQSGALLSNIMDLAYAEVISWGKNLKNLIVHFITDFISRDYSTTVEILNNQPGTSTMVLDDIGADEGYFAIKPANTIPPGGRTRFMVKDNPGPHGSRAWVKYRFVDNDGRLSEPITFLFGCPCFEWSIDTSSNDNYARIENQNSDHPFKYATNVDERAWYEEDVETGGKPLFVRFYHHKQEGWVGNEKWPDE